MTYKRREDFDYTAIRTAVRQYQVLAGQGGAVTAAAFGAAAAELRRRLNISLEDAAKILQNALE